MEETPCELLLKRIKAYYITKELDEFLAWTPSSETTSYKIRLYDPTTKQEVVFASSTFHPQKKELYLEELRRVHQQNQRESIYKGMGRALLHVIACKALDLRYTVVFSPFPGAEEELVPFYESSGFQRNKGRAFRTLPTRERFDPLIQETLSKLKNTSIIPSFSYKPVWKHTNQGKLIFECPLCHATSDIYLHMLPSKHTSTCPNRFRYPDLSEKPASGGLRKKKQTTKKLRRHARASTR